MSLHSLHTYTRCRNEIQADDAIKGAVQDLCFVLDDPTISPEARLVIKAAMSQLRAAGNFWKKHTAVKR
jgi:hypothetical protein